MGKANPENALVRSLLDYLILKGAVATRVNSGMIMIEGRVIRGASAGTSDIIACLPGGRYAAIEAKVGRNKPTRLQDAFLAEIRGVGGFGIVARSISDLENAGI